MDRGTGREISTEAALDILDQCEDAGLVTMPFNSQTPANICNCCPDCCIVLSALNRHPRPAEMIKPTFVAVTDQTLCEGCGTCTEKCPTAALSLTSDEVAQVNPDRCIGCGLCVVSCPTEAVRLEPRPADQRLDPPETTLKTFMEIHHRRRDPNHAGV
jgi:ferredoxin